MRSFLAGATLFALVACQELPGQEGTAAEAGASPDTPGAAATPSDASAGDATAPSDASDASAGDATAPSDVPADAAADAGARLYRVGAAKVAATGPFVGSSTGYNSPGDELSGLGMRLYARSFVIEDPARGARVALVTADMI